VRDQHGSNDEHHTGHPGRTANQTLLTAPAIDTDNEENGGSNDLDSSVDASGKQGRVRFAQSDLK
jgi:hypothetical protein